MESTLSMTFWQAEQVGALAERRVDVSPVVTDSLKRSTQCLENAIAPALDLSSQGSRSAAADDDDSDAGDDSVGSSKRGSGSSVQPASAITTTTRPAATIPRITPPEKDSNLDRQRRMSPEVITRLWRSGATRHTPTAAGGT